MSDNRKFISEILEKQNKLSKRIQNIESWEGVNATVPVYKNINFLPAVMAPGVAPPTDTIRAMGAAGSVFAHVLQFDNAVQNDVYFIAGMPTDLSILTPVTFYLCWIPGVAWSSGNYAFQIEYLYYNPGDASNVGVPAVSGFDVTPADSVTVIETAFDPSIVMGDKTRLFIHLYRAVGSDSGDSTGDVLGIRMRYTSNTLGTSV